DFKASVRSPSWHFSAKVLKGIEAFAGACSFGSDARARPIEERPGSAELLLLRRSAGGCLRLERAGPGASCGET
uniref:Uncharacterized protein n=1 Tax=Globisporangium ultimum (strain ATCC 200006 / CBS 805.95 / DAOM BR144) TaxID=431595 RepID=K3WM89_GLOUD